MAPGRALRPGDGRVVTLEYEAAFTILRWIHIAAGTVALFMAPAAMLTAKGGRAHRRWGKVYFWSMTVVALSAALLATWRPTLFLGLLAVFSFYLALSGYRALFRKRPAAGQKAARADWAAALLTLGASAALIGLGLARPSPTRERLGVVAITFGVLGVVLAGNDLRKFARPPAEAQAWWFDHMAGMLGSYIAAVSAFSVVNFTFLPTTLRWLWPTVVGTPLIALWITIYKARFRRAGGAPAAPAFAGPRRES